MSEGEAIEQLVEFTSILLLGVSVLFTVVSAYVVALNYFIGEARLLARLAAFSFITLILALLLVVMMGAANTQVGLVERLEEIRVAGELTAAGRAAIENAVSVDLFVRGLLWLGLISVYLVLGYLTFVHRWTPDVVNVALTTRKTSS